MKKIIAIFLFIIGLAFLANAQNVTVSLPGQLTYTPAPISDDVPTDGSLPEPIYCPKLSSTFSRGATDLTTGGQVTELQKFLMDYYDWKPITMIRGTFDRATQRVLIGFQKEKNIPAYGIAGTLTRQAITNVCNGNTIDPEIPSSGPNLIISTNKKAYQPGEAIEVNLQIINNTNSTIVSPITTDNKFNQNYGGYELIVNGVNNTSYFNKFFEYTYWKWYSSNYDYIKSKQSKNYTFKGTIPSYIKPGQKNITLRFNVSPNLRESYKSISEDFTINIDTETNNSTIKVTAPNGGEKWEIDTLNTVTWAPYQYNPDINPPKDVTAYLEVYLGTNEKGPIFETLGKVQETGAASIHWYAGALNQLEAGAHKRAPVGSAYFIRVVNNKTGASDRSDNPFSLIGKSVDIKVNGQDGSAYGGKPVEVKFTEGFEVSWDVVNATNCNIAGASEVPGMTILNNVQSIPVQGATGKKTLYPIITKFDGYPDGIINTISMSCTNQLGVNTQDYAQINLNQSVVGGTSMIRIDSPNGGEQVRMLSSSYTSPTKISWTGESVSSYSVALYKNDKWLTWIKKDAPANQVCSGTNCSIEWSPNPDQSELANANDLGSVYKIYITGQKVDGTGYIDDKSDATFVLVSSVTQTSRVKINPIYTYAGEASCNISQGQIGLGAITSKLEYIDGKAVTSCVNIDLLDKYKYLDLDITAKVVGSVCNDTVSCVGSDCTYPGLKIFVAESMTAPWKFVEDVSTPAKLNEGFGANARLAENPNYYRIAKVCRGGGGNGRANLRIDRIDVSGIK